MTSDISKRQITKHAFIEALFPEVASFETSDFSRIGSDRPTLMIAMTARTGSSHLCSGLSSALPIAMPAEILNARDSLVWEAKRRNVTIYADFISDYIRNSDDIIVFKTSWLDFDYFKDRIWNMFPKMKILYLNRLDIEAQAVSLYKAEISGYWHNSPMIEKPPSISQEELNNYFDLIEICRRIASLEKEKRCWEDYFFSRRLQPMRINYEHFQFELELTVNRIIEYFDIGHVNIREIQSQFRPISDNINNEWLTKVKNYRNGLFYQRFYSSTSADTHNDTF